ncbi:MAG: aminomethyl-transferring glycine dehydrogenase subunit GcvPB [Elusimicrobiaceae bacterium]|nr:aminomethyl-transferring glycine dehydrogenase subunit GcvPB [Elusimicrobiaceae bacterium]
MLQNKLSIEKSRAGRRGVRFESVQKHAEGYLPKNLLRTSVPHLPELSEFDTVRHFTRLSQLNYSLDGQFYPLGSCTMKYNPKAYDTLSVLEPFASAHPFAPESAVQGTLQVMYELQELLKEITGLAAFTLQPAAGAHGELTGILTVRAYHDAQKNGSRTEVIVPDTAHGTNPATANMAGYTVVNIKSAADGCVDKEALQAALSDKTAAVMLTVPNTVGLFEKDIREIADMVHKAGALLYMDGANFNALIGLAKPVDFGVDVMHLNLHKTFAAPHGGGGPGSGPVGAAAHVAPFLPKPIVEKKDGVYTLTGEMPQSLGKMKAFYGNIAICLRGYCYLRQFDANTLKNIAEKAILNANYVRAKLKGKFNAFFDENCMHECVLSINPKEMNGVHTADVAKRLLDYGFYAPTIYFPLIVPEAMMVEPTETESKEMLDAFVDALEKIYDEIQTNVQLLHDAPTTQPVARIDEVSAARNPNLRW